MTLALVVGAAILAAILTGVAGALTDAVIAALFGLTGSSIRGLGGSVVAPSLAMLPAGSAAAIARTATPELAGRRGKLTRLDGGVAAGAVPAAETVGDALAQDSVDHVSGAGR